MAPAGDPHVSRAWRAYLRETVKLRDLSYEDAEPEAWKRLQSKLDTIERPRRVVA